VRVLVTGATGLIGRHTVPLLQGEGYQVRTFQRGQSEKGWEQVQGNVADDLGPLVDAARGCQALVHLAGKGDVVESRRDPAGYARLTTLGTVHALEAARQAGAHCVFASTQRVYPLIPSRCREDDPLDPDSPYGYAKWMGELWCRMQSTQFDLPTTVLRFFSVFGPGQQPNGVSGVATIFARAALRGEPLVVQSHGRRDFTDARDAARGILLALQNPPMDGTRTLNVGTGVATSFAELAREVVEVAHSHSEIVMRASDAAGKDLVPDVSRARAEIGFEPTISLTEGLERYVAWLRSEQGLLVEAAP
jgi:UDP-glucose 4-epimerase